MKKSFLRNICFVSALTTGLSHFAFAQREIPSSGQATQASLGDGYDSSLEKFQGTCLDVKPDNIISVGQQTSTINFSRAMTSNEARSSLGYGVSARAKFGLTTASAAAKFARETSSDEYSESATYSSEVYFKNLKIDQIKLREEAQRRTGSAKRFREMCGNEYVEQVKIGASLYVNLKFQFATKADKESFGTQVSVSGPLYGVSAQLQTASSNFAKSGFVSVRLMQLGGDVRQLATVFDAAAASADASDKASPTENSPLAIIHCSMTNLSACTKVLESAIRYASDRNDPNSFPNQIDPAHASAGSSSGPAALLYITKPWANAGVSLPNPVTSASAEQVRKQIGNRFEEEVLASNRVNALGISRLRFSPRQRSAVTQIERKINMNIAELVESANKCWEDDRVCADESLRLFGGTGRRGRLIEPVLNEISMAELDIQPETFAQYCDVAKNPLYALGVGKTTGAMFKYAETLVTGGSLASSSDPCGDAEIALSHSTELHLSGYGLTHLKPLLTVPGIKRLYLNRNMLIDLSPLSELKALEKINLNHNPLQDLSVLSTLPSVKVVQIAGSTLMRKVGELRVSFPSIRFVSTQDDACEEERIELFQSGKVDENLLNRLIELNLAPIYERSGDRSSPIFRWEFCRNAAGVL